MEFVMDLRLLQRVPHLPSEFPSSFHRVGS